MGRDNDDKGNNDDTGNNDDNQEFLDVADGKTIPLAQIGNHSPAVHVFEEQSVLAINASLAACRPLLVRGEPGTGKTQLARAAAQELGRAFVSKTVDSRSEARDLLWTFDAVARLAEGQVLGAAGNLSVEQVRQQLEEELFLKPGPLWWAFDWDSALEQQKKAKISGRPPERPSDSVGGGCVVLIDEIDKADSSVPNGLLEALGSGRFEAPGYPQGIAQTGSVPLVVVTTNEERSLPDAFLRRCLVLQLSLPTKAGELRSWLVNRGRAHFSDCATSVLEKAADLLLSDREAVGRRGLSPPGQAEYLDLIRALEKLRPRDEPGQQELLERIRPFALEKHPRDPGDLAG